MCQPCPDFKGIKTVDDGQNQAGGECANHALISKGLRPQATPQRVEPLCANHALISKGLRQRRLFAFRSGNTRANHALISKGLRRFYYRLFLGHLPVPTMP